MKRVGLLALCALLVLFMLLVPGYVQQQVDQDIYLQWMSGKRGWEGVLRVWHVSNWYTATGSDGGAWLSARARDYEKKHFGLFIEIQTVTPASAAKRLAEGERPDLWSFSTGFAPEGMKSPAVPDLFSPFGAGDVADLPDLLPGLLQSGRAGFAQAALPYSMGGCMLLWNTDLLDSREVQTPDLGADPPETWTAETLAAAVKAATYTHKIGKRTNNYIGLSYATGNHTGLAGLMGRLPVLGAGESVPGEDAFLNGTSAFCAGTTGTMGALEKLEAAGKGFSYGAEAAGSFTDCVQYVAVSAGLGEEREHNAKDFALSLLRDKAQQQLAASGALPVVSAAADYSLAQPDAYVPAMRSLAQALLSPRVPNAFVWGERREEIAALCPAALTGDAAAIAKLRAIMLE